MGVFNTLGTRVTFIIDNLNVIKLTQWCSIIAFTLSWHMLRAIIFIVYNSSKQVQPRAVEMITPAQGHCWTNTQGG